MAKIKTSIPWPVGNGMMYRYLNVYGYKYVSILHTSNVGIATDFLFLMLCEKLSLAKRGTGSRAHKDDMQSYLKRLWELAPVIDQTS